MNGSESIECQRHAMRSLRRSRSKLIDDSFDPTGTRVPGSRPRLWVGLSLAALGSLMLAGCGSSDSDEGAASNGAVIVNIEAGDYFFKSPLTTFEVGVPYHFVVENTSGIEHELMIIEPIAAGAMSMEEMDDLAMAHVEEDDLQAGQTSTLDVTFTEPAAAGVLEFSCHVNDHYEKGMKLPIVVE